MNLIDRIICFFQGHIPINVGSGLYDKYDWICPQFERTKCARCGADVSILENVAIVKKIDHWELDENTRRSLVVKDFLSGEGSLSKYYHSFLISEGSSP